MLRELKRKLDGVAVAEASLSESAMADLDQARLREARMLGQDLGSPRSTALIETEPPEHMDPVVWRAHLLEMVDASLEKGDGLPDSL